MAEQFTVEGDVREPVIVDPRVGSVIEMAEHFQSELDRFPADIRRVREMLFTLDHAWPYYMQEVKVSGLVTSSVVNVDNEIIQEKEEPSQAIGLLIKDDGEPEKATYFVREVEFTSFGFDARWEDFVVGGMPIGTHFVIQLALKRTASVALPYGIGQREVSMDCSSNLHEASIDFPQESLGFSVLQACESFPEAFEEIEAKLSEQETPAKNILALKGIVVRMGSDINPQAIRALERYVEELSQIKKEPVPFVMNIRAGSAVLDPELHTRCIQHVPEQGSMYVFADGIQLAPKVEVAADEDVELDVSETELEFRVIFRNIAGQTGVHSKELAMRVRDVDHMWNSREDFHRRAQAGD